MNKNFSSTSFSKIFKFSFDSMYLSAWKEFQEKLIKVQQDCKQENVYLFWDRGGEDIAIIALQNKYNK